MLRRLTLAILVCLTTLLVGCIQDLPRARAGVLDLRGQSLETIARGIPLNGEWEFYWKEFLFEPNANSPDTATRGDPGKPNLINVPGSWTRSTAERAGWPAEGYASYRLRLLLDEPVEDLAFRVREAGHGYRFYLNGELIMEEGDPARTVDAMPMRLGRLQPIPGRLERENEIVIEVASYLFHEGGIRQEVHLASNDRLENKRTTSIATTTMLLGTLAFLALYHLVLVALDRREIGALAIVAMSVGMFVRFSMTDERLIYTVWPDIDFLLFVKIIIMTTYALLPAVGHMMRYTFPGHISPVFVRTTDIFAAGLCLFVLFTDPVVYMHTLPLWSLFCVTAGAYGSLILFRAIRARAPDSGIFLGTYALFLAAAINDMLFSLGFIQTEYLSRYGISAFVIFQAFTVSRRILRSRRLSEKLAADLERSNERLRSLDRLKDDFLARTSHELRTPLQGIIGITDSLREEVASDSIGQKKLDLIMGSGRRLSGLVNEILDFTRMQHGDIQLNLQTIDLRAFADLQLELIAYSHQIREDIELINDIPAGLPGVAADEARLTQIVQNLLDNALRATPTGSVRVSAERPATGDLIHVHVTDSGPGIPLEQRDHIFQPFEQGPTAKGRAGLGLAIARSLVAMHGGTIWLDSMKDGARFSFSLPLATKADQPAVSPDPERSTKHLTLLPRITTETRTTTTPRANEPASATDANAAGEAIGPVHQNGRVQVLLVDDESVNLEVMQFYVQQEAWNPILARNAAEARAILRRDPLPDCLVLDLMMPDVSGLELTRELRREYSLAELPILMVTALTGTNDFVAALDAGANDYLAKPFEKEEFLFRVANLTTLSRTRRAGQRALLEAARRERLRINSDLHDHLGANLTDLKNLSTNALKDATVPDAFAERLRHQVKDIIQIFRNDLLNLEDQDMLEENFFNGVNMLLLRRYVDAGRELEFDSPAETEPLALTQESANLSVIATVIKEIATNDLKYGSGTAHWTMRLEDETNASGRMLAIRFESHSHYHLATHGTGRGTAGMLRRLSEIGGTLRISLDNTSQTSAEHERPIRIRIKAPVGQGTRP